MSLSVSIGLLWNESEIRGELRGPFHLRARMEAGVHTNVLHGLNKTGGRGGPPLQISGAFCARAMEQAGVAQWGIRLAESLSPDHAERQLNSVLAHTTAFELDILEAGRTWESDGTALDNRVWWPVVKLATRDDAEPVLELLRTISTLDPLGFSIVRLDVTEPRDLFEFSCGDFSARVLDAQFIPASGSSLFRLHNVPIGRGFHWERKESLDYRGELKLFAGTNGLTAVNVLPLETYLESAVGSEMRSDLPPAFSQAQAICARSTVLATAGRHHRADGFDLCNDDHCQCYQGVQREAGAVIAPIRDTAGQILAHGERVVDARYAKSCGGISERYEAAWGAEGPDYFAVRACGDFAVPDLRDESAARAFLEDAPPAWCNPRSHPYPEPWDKDPLYRWEFRYDKRELGELIARKTSHEVGNVRSLSVLKRGASGRILILEIEGSTRTQRIYGELNIRRALSASHLPSSFFVCDDAGDSLILRGGGWGHGVGLCQLGACAMAKAGWSVEQILAHYYPGSCEEKLKAEI
jgi:stage II sporulation protein D